MKTPITYYGGKQRLLKHILPLIPKHTLYAEPFAGGAAVLFAKQPSEIEVINDTNRQLVTFYQVAKSDFKRLRKKILATLHSRDLHKYAGIVYAYPQFFSKVDIAWAVWTLSSTSFAASLEGTFGYDKSKGTMTKRISNKKDAFTNDLAKRLEKVTIESRNALEVIRSRDAKDSFFYCDPPYFNSQMAHYKGYSEDDFGALLKVLSTIKGKFLLSSYPSEILKKYIADYGWQTRSHEHTVAISPKALKLKQEVLTANYPIQLV